MPELLAALLRKESRNSKSLVVPLVQMMNVFPLAGFSAVVSPRITPSFTLHSRGSPSQPVRSLPLKSDCIPGSSGGAVGASAARTKVGTKTAARTAIFRIMIFSRDVRRVDHSLRKGAGECESRNDLGGDAV